MDQINTGDLVVSTNKYQTQVFLVIETKIVGGQSFGKEYNVVKLLPSLGITWCFAHKFKKV